MLSKMVPTWILRKINKKAIKTTKNSVRVSLACQKENVEAVNKYLPYFRYFIVF